MSCAIPSLSRSTWSAAPESQSVFHSESHEDTYSEELRLNGDDGKVKWVTGVYFLDILNSTQNDLEFPASSPFATNPLILGAPGAVDTVGFINLHTISSSVFGQVDWSFADQWTLVGGGRYVKERKDYSFDQGVYQARDDRIINTSVQYATLFPYRPFNSDNNLYAGKLQLEYRPHTDLLWYWCEPRRQGRWFQRPARRWFSEAAAGPNSLQTRGAHQLRGWGEGHLPRR